MERPCIRCDDAATTVVIEVGTVEATLDLCERHVADLLRGSRRLADGSEPSARIGMDAGTRPKATRGRRPERLAP